MDLKWQIEEIPSHVASLSSCERSPDPVKRLDNCRCDQRDARILDIEGETLTNCTGTSGILHRSDKLNSIGTLGLIRYLDPVRDDVPAPYEVYCLALKPSTFVDTK